MRLNKDFPFNFLFFWATTALFSTANASKVVLRDPCTPTHNDFNHNDFSYNDFSYNDCSHAQLSRDQIKRVQSRNCKFVCGQFIRAIFSRDYSACGKLKQRQLTSGHFIGDQQRSHIIHGAKRPFIRHVTVCNTNANLSRSNEQYARLYNGTTDAQGSKNLDFALASTTSANVFTLDSQNRLLEINLGFVATSQYGTTQKVWFDPVGNFLNNYTAIACSVQPASGSSAYGTLQCTGPGSVGGNQTITAVCYGSSNTNTNGANGKLFLSSSLATVNAECRSVTLDVVPYVLLT
ncbi:hypothetical protein VMCG_01825 [Cytospora schulzeri]|uniref:Uncharacterized protein n=1 Tax=Cytospora schulzeri TaxID=448051 RepID=A0A423X3W3_9PEZI|nr:hypothetical protein VMCG_01825 [Valsa malicola]